MPTFRGGGTYSVDDKGRIIIPQKFRSVLGERFVITRGFEGCLYLFTEDQWRDLDKMIDQKQFFDTDASRLQRFLFGEAWDATIDQQGRAQVSQELRSYAGIETNSEVKVIGCSRWIEIWNKDVYDRYIEEELKADLRIVAERAWKNEPAAT